MHLRGLADVHTWGLPIALALPLGMAFGFGLGGALTEVALVRPVGRKSQFAVFIVTIGLFTGLNWLAAAIWGTEALPKTIAGKRPPFPKLMEG